MIHRSTYKKVRIADKFSAFLLCASGCTTQMAGRKPVEVLYEPDPVKACDEVKKSVLYRRAVVLIGDFSLRQDDKQVLPRGERMLMVKSDWTVIIHRDSFSAQPVLAWEKCDSIRVVCGDPLSLVAEKEEEENAKVDSPGAGGVPIRFRSLEADFNKIFAVISTNLVDGTILLEPGDGELLTAVLLKPELIEPGFKPLPANGEMKSGFVDLIGIDAHGNKTVVFLTKGEGTYKNVAELSRYIASVRRHLNSGENIRGILAAPSASEKAKVKLSEYGFEFRRIDLRDVKDVLSYYKAQLDTARGDTVV